MYKSVILSIIVFIAGCDDELNKEVMVSMENEPDWTKNIRQSTFNMKDLPENIKDELVDYLNREYGVPHFSEAFVVSDLTLVGDFVELDMPIRIWEYQCGNDKKCYVGAQPYGDGYMIGSTLLPDGQKPNSE